jgi:hypothetical protein
MGTSHTTVVVPFRWDVARPHELGCMMNAEPAPAYPAFAEDLRACCAAVIAAAGDADLVFVGRSPESLHDYLRGACFDTSWNGRLRLLLVSVDHEWPAVRRIVALQNYLATLGLDPRELPRRERPVALVDLIWSGRTLGTLVRLMHQWTLQIRPRGDWRAVRDKLRVVGITEQDFSVRNVWHHQRRLASGGGLLKRKNVANVTVLPRLWKFLGDEQLKVAESHTPQWWDDERAARPPRDPDRAAALRAAVEIFRRARDRPERERFVRELSRHGALRHEAIRNLAAELRFGGQITPSSRYSATSPINAVSAAMSSRRER